MSIPVAPVTIGQRGDYQTVFCALPLKDGKVRHEDWHGTGVFRRFLDGFRYRT
jgi:hypothetical protein